LPFIFCKGKESLPNFPGLRPNFSYFLPRLKPPLKIFSPHNLKKTKFAKIIRTMSEKKDLQNALNIELTEEVAEGIYSNLAIISHSNSEFIIDFIKMMPGIPKAKVKARILLTPQHAKRLLKALNDNVKKFETQNGVIKDSDGGFNIPPMNFGGPPAQA